MAKFNECILALKKDFNLKKCVVRLEEVLLQWLTFMCHSIGNIRIEEVRIPKLYGLLLLIMTSWSGMALGQSSSSPYCSFSPFHTLCLHSGLGPRCGNDVQLRGVNPQDASLILAQHNQLRSQVAIGQEERGAPGPQPQASNMRLLEWDNELAIVAQSHADQCSFAHECSDCRRVSRFGVGQNLFISFQGTFRNRIRWSRTIKSWYDDVAQFNPNDIRPFRYSASLGHYTQMMWWNTYKVGCGFTMFREGGWWKKLYTCTYGPGGNILFSEMYRRGTPCSSCPAGTSCSIQYPGLCVSSQSIPLNTLSMQRSIPFPFLRPNLSATVPVISQEEEEEMFIPFRGEQPQIADLLPFLKGFDNITEIIGTASILSVKNIIAALPIIGLNKTIVFYRSGTAYPLDGSSTTRQPNREATDVLLICDLDVSPCEYSSLGGGANWTTGQSPSEGRYTEAVLEEGEGAQLSYQKGIPAPTTNSICVAISHHRDLEGGHPNATIPELKVGVMINDGEVTHKRLGGAPGIWEITRVSFSNVKTSFVVVMTVSPATERATVAIDALQISNGLCCTAGNC